MTNQTHHFRTRTCPHCEQPQTVLVRVDSPVRQTLDGVCWDCWFSGVGDHHGPGRCPSRFLDEEEAP